MTLTFPGKRKRGRGSSRVLLACLCLFSMVACGNPVPSATSFEGRLAAFANRARAHPERIALLVGVSDYSASGLPSLPGSRNDVELIQGLLVERFGYSPGEIFVLLDEEATHANIVRCFDLALIQPARANSEAFVYLSGHGSRIVDQADTVYAEPDGTDSTFVTFDSRQNGQQGQRDFSDDELRSLLAALTRKTDRVVVVTDSCHSGGLVRGAQRAVVPEAQVALDQDWLRTFWPAGVPLNEDGPGQRLDASRFVHIAASRRDQTAQEISVSIDGQERAFGALTYYLVKTLENSALDASWSDVIDTLAVRVRREAHQSITARGDIERRVFSSGSAGARGYRARATINSAQIEIQAGFLLGLREGSLLAVHDLQSQTPVGTAIVESVFPDRSMARWKEAPLDPAPLAFRVHETHRGAAEPPLRVLMDGAQALAELPLVQLVESDDQPAYRVVSTDAGEQIETMEGIPIGPATNETLEEELTFAALRALATEQGHYTLSLTLRAPDQGELEALGNALSPIQILSSDAHSCAVVGAPLDSPIRSVAMFDITNESSERLFVYLLSLEDSRQRNLITIPNQDDCIVLEPGETSSIPAAIVARESWRPTRPMLDRYLALAFPKQELRNPRSLESRRSVQRGETDPLPDILEHLFHGQFTRGHDPVPLSPEGWGVAHLDLLVVKKTDT